ncbi:MAG: hypothetical protein IH964_13180 [Candidatus Dadabacteria bacterium]|nr:hypothetical protein [Candidatus Dadabacteria bacterium]
MKSLLKDKNVRTEIIFKSESQVSEKVIEFAKARRLEPITEVPFLGRSIDIVWQWKNGTITAVEVKKRGYDIERAIHQAKFCLLGAHRVYICIPNTDINDSKTDMLKGLGIGLILVKHNDNNGFYLNYVIGSRPNSLRNKEFTKLLRKHISEVKETVL